MARKQKRLGAQSTVRERLRSLRQERGYTQEALAEQAGVSVDAVTRIESGKRSPRLDTLERLAQALAVDLETLVAPAMRTKSDIDEDLARIGAMLRGRPKEFLLVVESVLKSMLRLLR